MAHTRGESLALASPASMLGRLADLTWNRPKLVLTLVAAFAVLAAMVGRDSGRAPPGRGLHRQLIR